MLKPVEIHYQALLLSAVSFLECSFWRRDGSSLKNGTIMETKYRLSAPHVGDHSFMLMAAGQGGFFMSEFQRQTGFKS